MAKVLVVDDSLSVRKVVERALAGRRIDVVQAASGSVARELIERESPDVIVCDVIMPDQDGCDICAFVKSHPRLGRTPVLLMSGIVSESVRERAAHVGADDILLKPFAADDLVARLERLLPTLTEPAVEPAPPAPAVEPAPPAPPPEPVLAPPPAESPSPRPSATATVSAPTGEADLGSILQRFMAMDGVQWAVLADREGFVLESVEGTAIDAGIGGALSACLAEASQGLGRELGRGAVSSVIVEFEKGTVVVWSVGDAALLAVGLGESSALGKLRYYAKKALAELARLLLAAASASADRGEPVDRGVADVGGGPRGRAGHDQQVQLDHLTPLLLEDRADAAAGGQMRADARSPEVTDDAADVDPRADVHVVAERAVGLLQEERGMDPALPATVIRQRVRDELEILRGAGLVIDGFGGAERGQAGQVLGGRDRTLGR
jgi:CheY-like chemotaxis protein/predicted regulator of Ras-like GTPase activity (Roadblock/LC7/MglB family)